ncbi:hypothetical protein Holit_02865 [Hollandina sp. SP2]
MKRISFNPRFVNETRDDLIPGKIHTIRQHYSFWKKFEGRDIELFTWDGKPYRSKQKVFAVKRLVSVKKVRHAGRGHFFTENERYIPTGQLVVNDGFRDEDEFIGWFVSYSEGEMGILHFTNFRY